MVGQGLGLGLTAALSTPQMSRTVLGSDCLAPTVPRGWPELCSTSPSTPPPPPRRHCRRALPHGPPPSGWWLPLVLRLWREVQADCSEHLAHRSFTLRQTVQTVAAFMWMCLGLRRVGTFFLTNISASSYTSSTVVMPLATNAVHDIAPLPSTIRKKVCGPPCMSPGNLGRLCLLAYGIDYVAFAVLR